MSQLENIDESQLEQSLLSGEYEIPADRTINMFDSDGNLVGVSGSDVGDALQQGWKLESNKQAAVRRYVDSKDNLAGSIEVALKQFGDEAAFGVPELIAEKTGNPFEVEKWQALKEKHDTANTLGGLAGFGASFLVGAPVMKAGTAAGKAAERVVAQKLGEYGVKRGAKNVAADLLARTAGTGANLAVDAMVSSAPRTLTEAALGDYEAAAESLLLNGGIGLVLGGTGGLAKGVFDRSKKAVEAYKESLTGPNVNISKFDPSGVVMPKDLPKEAGATVASEMINPNNLDEVLTASGVETKAKTSLLQELAKKKENAKEIVETFRDLGVDPDLLPPDVLLDSTPGLTIIKALENKPNFIGIKMLSNKDNMFRALENTGEQILQTKGPARSAFDIGSQIKSELVTKVDDVLKAQEEVFGQLNIARAEVDVNQKPLLNAVKDIDKLPQFKGSGLQGIVKKFEQAALNNEIKTVQQLAEWRTTINDTISPISASKNDRFIIGRLSKYLDGVEERAIDNAFNSSLKNAKSQGLDPISLGALWKQRQEANKGYRELAESLAEEGNAIGFTSRNPYDFKRKLENMTSEDFVKSFTVKNDVQALQTIQSRYPQQFELIKDFVKKNVYERAMTGDRLSARKVVSEVKKMTPEFAEKIFSPTELAAFKKLKTAVDSLPQNMNPPETGRMISYQDALSPASLMSNASSYLQEKALKAAINVEGILQTDKAIQATRSKLDMVSDAVKGLSKAIEKSIKATTSKPTVMGLERLFEDEPEKQKERKENIIKKINDLNQQSSDFVVNPELFINKVQEITSGLSEAGAPTVATAFGAKADGMVRYINQSVPKPKTAQNVFMNRPFVPSTQEISQFERKMSVLADPFIVIDALKDGSLTKEHVEALAMNYPKLYQAIQARIFDVMVQEKPNMSYQARLKLSLLMGTDVDPSLSGGNVKGLQDAWMTPEGQETSGLRVSGLKELGESTKAAATETQQLDMRA
jgi:hypothetical protein